MTTSAEPPASPAIPLISARQVMAGTLVVMLMGLGFWLLMRERVVVFSLFEAIVISTAINPAVDWLQRRGLARTAGVGFCANCAWWLMAIYCSRRPSQPGG